MASFLDVTTDLAALGLTNLDPSSAADQGPAIQELFTYLGAWDEDDVENLPVHPYIILWKPGTYLTAQRLYFGGPMSGIKFMGGSGPDINSNVQGSNYGSSVRLACHEDWADGAVELLELEHCPGVEFHGFVFDNAEDTDCDVGLKLSYKVGASNGNGLMNRCTWKDFATGVHFAGPLTCANWQFTGCAWHNCTKAVYKTITHAWYNTFNHCRFDNCVYCFYYDQLLGDYLVDCYISRCNYFLWARNVYKSVSGITVERLYIHGAAGTVETKLFKTEDTANWSNNGAIVFRSLKTSDQMGRFRGTTGTVANNGSGKCRLTLTHTTDYLDGTTRTVAGEKILLEGCGESSYNTTHEITAVVQQGVGGSDALIVDTDIDYVDDDSVTFWCEGEALFTLRGGGLLSLTDSMIDWERCDRGRLVDMQPGDRGDGWVSRASIERCYYFADEIGASPTMAELTYSDTNVDGIWRDRAGTGDVAGWSNYIRFTDCYDTTGNDSAPWFCGNYGMTDTDIKQLRYRLGMDGTTDTPAASGGAKLVDVDGKTFQEAMRIVVAVAAGKITTAGQATETFIGLDGSTPRVVVTVDPSGNRSAIEYP